MTQPSPDQDKNQHATHAQPQRSLFDRERAVTEHVSLVEKIARRVAARLPASVELDDLKSAGFIGLLDAIEKFSDDKETPFHVYAEIRIRGAMMDELRSQDWVPRSVRDRNAKLRNATAELEQRLGRAPTESELSAELGVSLDELKQLKARAEIRAQVSIEDVKRRRADEGRRDPFEEIADPKQSSPEMIALEADEHALLNEALRHLNDRKRLVLQLYFFEEMKLREIGETLGVTESRVCQIQSEALNQLKSIFKRLQNS